MNAPCPPATMTGAQVIITTFTVSGTYQPSPGLIALVVECIGGGGAGGGCTSNANWVVGGGGGGSGGHSRKALPAALVAGGVIVTVAGAAPIGSNGFPTSFGALCSASGGGQGQANDGVDALGIGGNGAPPGIGDVAFPGASGACGMLQSVPAGASMLAHGAMGGWTMAGGTEVTAAGTTGGIDGNPGMPNTGAGGSGGCSNEDAGAVEFSGGAGGSGVCIVTEYCWAGATNCGNARVSSPGWCPPGGWDNCW